MKSISNQISVSILLTIIIVFGGWGFVEIQNTTKYETERVAKNQVRIAERLAYTLAYPVWNLNDAAVKSDIQNEALDENVQSILVFDEYGQPYMGVFRNNKTGKLTVIDPKLSQKQFLNSPKEVISRKIVFRNRNIGSVKVSANEEPLLLFFKYLRINLLLKLVILIISISVVLFLVLRKVVIKPLLLLKDWTSSIKPGQKPPTPKFFHSTEIDSLQVSFSDMANRLIFSLNEVSDKNMRLEESESRVKSISNNFTNGMIYQVVTRLDGYRKFTYLSDTVQKLYGITPEEGMADANLIYSKIHPDDVQALIDRENEAMQSLSTFMMETRMRELSGNYRWSSFISTPKLLPDGSVCWDGIEFVITDRKMAEIKLQNLNHDKDRFMSILGHDLRSPVGAVVGILELLKIDFNVLNREEIEELLDMAHRSSRNASELLDDVLMWATAQSGKMPFDPQKINLPEMCSHIIEILQANVDAKNIAINLNLDEELLILADKNMLNTILRNLISNALKFTPNGGTVEVSTQRTPETTVISVSDNGIGIKQEDMGKLFDKTKLFTSSGTAQEKGTGFGLKLCQEFVEKHGGSIWLESEVGKGTTIHFSLPNVYQIAEDKQELITVKN